MNLRKAEQSELNLDFSESEEMTGNQIIWPYSDKLKISYFDFCAGL